MMYKKSVVLCNKDKCKADKDVLQKVLASITSAMIVMSWYRIAGNVGGNNIMRFPEKNLVCGLILMFAV